MFWTEWECVCDVCVWERESQVTCQRDISGSKCIYYKVRKTESQLFEFSYKKLKNGTANLNIARV